MCAPPSEEGRQNRHLKAHAEDEDHPAEKAHEDREHRHLPCTEASAGKRRDHDHEGDGEQDAELEERDGEDRDAAEDESEYAPVDAFEGAVAITGEEQSAKAQAAAEQGQNDAKGRREEAGPHARERAERILLGNGRGAGAESDEEYACPEVLFVFDHHFKGSASAARPSGPRGCAVR